MTALADIFLAEHDDVRATVTREPLQRMLEGAIARGREAWPDVSCTGEALTRHLARLGDLDVEAVHGDLWLACAALTGDETAVAALHGICRDLGAKALPSTRIDAAAQQDVTQRVESRLLTGTGTSPPALANYRGLGSMRSWLRVALIREALRARASADVEIPFEDGVLQTLAIDVDDPETQLLKDKYVAAFRGAFKQSLSELTTRERNLLRYLVVESMAVAEVAGLYNVNRSTVWRWMGSTRETLLKRTRNLLRQDLGISESELDSIMRLIHSRLTATLSALAASEAASEAP